MSDGHPTKAAAIADAVDCYRSWATDGRNNYWRVQCFIDELAARQEPGVLVSARPAVPRRRAARTRERGQLMGKLYAQIDVNLPDDGKIIEAGDLAELALHPVHLASPTAPDRWRC